MSNQPDMASIMEALAEFDLEDLSVDITDDSITLTGKGANADIVQQAYDKLQAMGETQNHTINYEITYDEEEYEEKEDNEEDESEEKDENEEECEEEDESEEEEEEDENEEETSANVDLNALLDALSHLDIEDLNVEVADDNSVTITGRATADVISEAGDIANSFENVAAVNNDMEFIDE